MSVIQLIKKKLEEKKNQTWLVLAERNGYERAISIVDEVAQEYPKTPTPDHPIPIDTQQYIAELEAKVNNNGWIPCSERLPETEDDVLVWYEYYRYGSYNRLYQTYGISYMYDGKWSNFVNGESGWHQLRIIAWQPLPAPYKEGHSDEYIKGYNQGTIDRADEIQKAREYGYNKAIDEFAEKLKRDYQAYDIDLCLQDNDHLSYTNSCTALESYIDEIAEQLKGGSNDE